MGLFAHYGYLSAQIGSYRYLSQLKILTQHRNAVHLLVCYVTMSRNLLGEHLRRELEYVFVRLLRSWAAS